MVFGDEGSLTATFLIFCEHEHAKNVALSRVFELCKDFSIRVKPESRLVGIRLIEPVEFAKRFN